jgi:hypothetical protein
MSLVRVRALADFVHRGTSYHTGQLLDLPPVDAIVLHRRHKVTMTRALAVDPPHDLALQEKRTEADLGADEASDDEATPKRRRGRPRKVDADDVHE